MLLSVKTMSNFAEVNSFRRITQDQTSKADRAGTRVDGLIEAQSGDIGCHRCPVVCSTSHSHAFETRLQ